MRDAYWRQARVDSVTDGDTLRMTIDLGFRCYAEHAIRLLGVDTPELRGEGKEAGQMARSFVCEWVMEHAHEGHEWPYYLHTRKADSFGRYLGIVCCREGHVLNSDLITSGNATPWEGRDA